MGRKEKRECIEFCLKVITKLQEISIKITQFQSLLNLPPRAVRAGYAPAYAGQFGPICLQL